MSAHDIRNEVGKGTEKFVAKTLKRYGYWSYIFPKKISGQPCDVIALKENESWLIDAKHVRIEEVSFPFSRIEPNQVASMEYARNYAKIKNLGFAVFFERTKELYWFSYDEYIRLYESGFKSVNICNLKKFIEVISNENNH